MSYLHPIYIPFSTSLYLGNNNFLLFFAKACYLPASEAIISSFFLLFIASSLLPGPFAGFKSYKFFIFSAFYSFFTAIWAFLLASKAIISSFFLLFIAFSLQSGPFAGFKSYKFFVFPAFYSFFTAVWAVELCKATILMIFFCFVAPACLLLYSSYFAIF